MALRRGGRGVTRVLQQLFPLLVADARLDCAILSSAEGRELLELESLAPFHEVPAMSQSMWEQYGLAHSARQVGADAVYSFAECGPLWGPPTLLHVPEDPFVRWQGFKADTHRERVRRTYQRLTMGRGLRHAALLAACSSAGRSALVGRFGLRFDAVEMIPLGVDMRRFHPNSPTLPEDGVFHLSSSEARDMTTLVVCAYAKATSLVPDLPDLFIAGELGLQRTRILDTARACGVDHRVRLLGRISDEELRHRYASAVLCVQPSTYEGFGLQPLEALACGAPLIVFPEPAVEEVVGGAAVFTGERTEHALATAIARLWSEPAQRSVLRDRGPERAQAFSWVRTATLVAELLLAVHDRAGAATPAGHP
jgi:glycosyltransferase involved in cell wall biosynthesis